MSSAGKRPRQKVSRTFFFCDLKACPNCSHAKTGCHHTSNPSHALSLEGEFKQDQSGNMWQVGTSVNGVIIDDSKRPNRITL